MIDNFMPRVELAPAPPPAEDYFDNYCTFQGIINSISELPSQNLTYGNIYYNKTDLVIYIWNGSTWSSFNCSSPPIITLQSLIALLDLNGDTIYTDTPLNDLKDYLTVLGVYDDNSVAFIDATDYSLSGTLVEGTSTITVTVDGITTTFDVEVKEP